MLRTADPPSSTTSPTPRRWIAFAAVLLLALALPLAGSAGAVPEEAATSTASEEIERPARTGPVQRQGQSAADRVSDLTDRAPAIAEAALVGAWKPSGLDPSEQLGVTPLRGPPQP